MPTSAGSRATSWPISIATEPTPRPRTQPRGQGTATKLARPDWGGRRGGIFRV